MLFYGCDNPFSPALGNSETVGSIISDQKTIDGVFQNLKYAYVAKDTSIYSKVLSNDFVFTYRDYDQGVDISWDKNEELRITNSIFQNTQNLNLIWNNIVAITSDSTEIIRSFNLTLTFNPSDVVGIDGRVKLTLKKSNNIWQIAKWTDDSNF